LGYGMHRMNEFDHRNTGLNILHLYADGKVEAKTLDDITHLQHFNIKG